MFITGDLVVRSSDNSLGAIRDSNAETARVWFGISGSSIQVSVHDLYRLVEFVPGRDYSNRDVILSVVERHFRLRGAVPGEAAKMVDIPNDISSYTSRQVKAGFNAGIFL